MEPSQKRSQSMIVQLRRSPLVWLGLVLVLIVPSLLLAPARPVQAKGPVPADLFMQSVVERDGNLGWHQLCPAVQAQLPLSVLTKQVQELHLAESGQGLTLTVDYLGAHARPQGGEIRVYVITGHRSDGWVGLRTYIIWTQASGCVEDVQDV